MLVKKNILLVAPYVTFPNEPGDNRFISIAQLLSFEYNVTLVTSRFCHILKQQRKNTPIIDGVNVVLIDEPGYNANVSFARLYSHNVFCKNFRTFFSLYSKKIDLVYSAYPLIKTNSIIGKFKNQRGYKFIIDVQDVWPEAITGPIPIFSSLLGRILISPISSYANKTYAYADALVAVSKTYLERADVNNLPADHKRVIFIGANELHYINHNKKNNSDKLVATYIGTMAGSYDLETVVKAAPLCHEQVKIQFIGTGPNENQLRNLNNQLGNHVEFLGAKNYKSAMVALCDSDLAINPIVATAQQSITNKLSDYFCCGLPILSCQENQEVKDLLALGGGKNYKSGNHKDLADHLIAIAQNKSVLCQMSEVNKLIAEERFLRKIAYKSILELINRLL
ncbi:glycosyltransferase [Acinetobacter modestus]|uniref:glycosyltransferase n=1 Tax=Acinetobacter modestus TaxID=1776740 RepID=UPI00202F4824|nr:glycosyltransferase [Acinetobacter modestus]MCM1960720.1 glycosyltransferase [Acinetobacter modestus]